MTTLSVFVIGMIGGFAYRYVHQGGGPPSGELQLQPLPLLAAAESKEDPWAAVLRVQPKGAGGSRQGTGFFIDQNGHLVTAAHVVEGGQCVTLLDQDGRNYDGTVLGMDRLLDIALVRVEMPGAPRAYLPMNDQYQLSSGTKVSVAHLVTGNEPVEQQGEIQRIGIAMSIDGRYLQNLAELKAVDAVPGMSGGPVVDPKSGKALGVLVAGTQTGSGYAMPFQESAKRVREWSALPTPAGCGRPVASTQTTLQLVTITPLSGLLGVWGADVADGAALALREMETELERVGYQVVLRRLDDGGNPAKAKEQATLVAADPQVIGVIGSLTNPLSEAVHDGLDGGHRAMIIPATPAEVPYADSGTPPFRLVPAVQEQMARLLNSLRQQHPVTKIVLLDDGTAMGAARVALFSDLVQANELRIVDRLSLGPEVTAEQISERISKAAPDVVYYGGNATTLRTILPTFAGRSWLLAGGAELADRGFESLPTAMTEGMLFPYPVTAPPSSFTTRFESTMGKPTAGLSAYGYDATMLMLQALAAWGAEHPAQVPDGEVLSRWIAGRTRYQGVSGRIGFRPNGENAEASIPIYRWSGGALQQVSKS